jgi:hypothetical protein
VLLALEMSLLARELSKAGHSARSSRMAEARAIASTYRGCGGNTEAAMGVFGPTLSRKWIVELELQEQWKNARHAAGIPDSTSLF